MIKASLRNPKDHKPHKLLKDFGFDYKEEKPNSRSAQNIRDQHFEL